MNLDSAAFLLLPVDTSRSKVVVQADGRWRLELPSQGADVVVWVRPPLPAGARALRALRSAALRELALLRLRRRPPPGLETKGLHRLPPPGWRGDLRDLARGALLGGALVELSCPTARSPRVLDIVAEAAGATLVGGSLRVGSGGTVLARVRLRGGPEGLLRVARKGTPGDPEWAALGLQRLAEAGLDRVPRLMARGETALASWSVESVLPGRRARRVGPGLIRQVARLCSGLPRHPGPITSVDHDLAVMARACPDRATAMERIGRRLRPLIAGLPAVMRHGDLWGGNVLEERGAVTGVVDWGSWHEAAVPGSDLFHLFCSAEGTRTRRPLGEVWWTRPWRSAPFALATSGYWRDLGIDPTPRLLDAIGVAWWAEQISGSLARLPHLAARGEWIGKNVDQVIEALLRADVPM